MRTTLDIDDDVLIAAKELARKDKVSAGQAAVEAVRSSPRGRGAMHSALGIEVLPRRGEIITNAHIDRLRDGPGV